MNNSELEPNFQEFKDKIESLRAELTHTGEQFLIKNFQTIFEKYPELESVSWTAYTPYFNDGEECVFKSYHRDPDFAWLTEESKETQEEACENEVRNFMRQFDSDLMYDLFGDHVEITITKEGITIGEYEHD